ncbi:MAG: hypothetical protein S0880_07395 [Actinomycetota bacterium]|nr:hypothetical protein [Actinomycetota bacterium]
MERPDAPDGPGPTRQSLRRAAAAVADGLERRREARGHIVVAMPPMAVLLFSVAIIWSLFSSFALLEERKPPGFSELSSPDDLIDLNDDNVADLAVVIVNGEAHVVEVPVHRPWYLDPGLIAGGLGAAVGLAGVSTARFNARQAERRRAQTTESNPTDDEDG